MKVSTIRTTRRPTRERQRGANLEICACEVTTKSTRSSVSRLGHDGVATPDVALGALAVEPGGHELPLDHDGLEDAVRQHRAVPQHRAVDLFYCCCRRQGSSKHSRKHPSTVGSLYGKRAMGYGGETHTHTQLRGVQQGNKKQVLQHPHTARINGMIHTHTITSRKRRKLR